MDKLDNEVIMQLLTEQNSTCVSIFMPTEKISVKDTRADVLRFKNLLANVTAKLTAIFGDERKALTFLKPATDLLGDDPFWQTQQNGMAMFLSDSTFEYFRLPVAFTEVAEVDTKFYISPLLDLMQKQFNYYILGVSKGSTKFMEADASGAREIELEALPDNIDEALWYRESERLLQMRNSAGEGGSFHGEGEDSREPNVEIREYLLKVNRAVSDYLKNRTEPFVICGLQPMLGIFLTINNYRNRYDIEHDPNRLSLQEFHELTWSKVSHLSREPINEMLNVYANYSVNQPFRVDNDAGSIYTAAQTGRIDTLLVARESVHSEVMAFHERIPSVHGTEMPAIDSLTEDTVQATLRNSGRVLMISQDEMPKGISLAAVLRY